MKSGISISKINEMINKGLASVGGVEWKLVRSVTSNTEITLPSSWKELKIVSKYDTYLYSRTISKDEYNIMNKFGGFDIYDSYNFNSSNTYYPCFADWYVNNNKIKLSGLYTYSDNNNKRDYATTYLYYR